MKIKCSVCGNKTSLWSGNITKGASGEWVCKGCLFISNTMPDLFKHKVITANEIKSQIGTLLKSTILTESKSDKTPSQGYQIKKSIVNYPIEITVPPRMEPPPINLVDGTMYKQGNNNIAFFKNGSLYNVSPRNNSISLDEDRGKAYTARYIVSDGVKYDLEVPESIKQIKIPTFNEIKGTPYLTRDIGYLLRMCAANETRTQLAVPLVYKAVSLMIASPIAFGKKDYFRIIAHLWTLGEIKYADYLFEEVKNCIPNIMVDNHVELVHQKAFTEQLNLAKKLGQDYLLSSDSRCVSETSAPYCNRLYCISGKDTRFPKLPDFILNQKGLENVSFYSQHYFSGDKITIYKYDKNGIASEKEVDAIKHSNRPFVDDRNKFEKAIYQEHLIKRQQREKENLQYYNREHWINKYYGKLEYKQIVDKLGDKAPKSFNGYLRMKNNNTPNFQKLVKNALKNGIIINNQINN